MDTYNITKEDQDEEDIEEVPKEEEKIDMIAEEKVVEKDIKDGMKKGGQCTEGVEVKKVVKEGAMKGKMINFQHQHYQRLQKKAEG